MRFEEEKENLCTTHTARQAARRVFLEESNKHYIPEACSNLGITLE